MSLLPTLDFGLGETIDILRETVRDFAAAEIAPRAAEIDRTNEFPRDLWPQLGRLGLLGITVEEEWGGAGMGYLAHVVAMEEISRASASVGLSYGAHSNLCVNQIRRHGTDAAEARVPAAAHFRRARRRARDERGGLGLRRREHAACAPRSAATATCSTAPRCGSPTVPTPTCWSSTRRPTRTRARAASPRSSSSAASRGSPLRPSSTSSACAARTRASSCSRAAKCRPKTCSAPKAAGVDVLMSGLDYERAVLAGGPLGIMRACLDAVLPYVHEREQFGQPVGSFQLMQGKLADMYTTLSASSAYVYAVARACDDGRVTRKDSAGAILYAAERATWMALEAIQALGGMGYVNESPTGRLLRDAKLYEIGAGTSEIRRWLIGRELFEETK